MYDNTETVASEHGLFYTPENSSAFIVSISQQLDLLLMLFTCSKEGIVLVCYGANAESDEVRNLARLVVIIGGMSAP